jgi:hypothetical protein
MAVLVDELREYPGVRLPYSTWCHMATDGDPEELHAFAARLGLQRRWYQRDHYDLPPHGRAAAVALGAEEVSSAELLARMRGPRGDRARRRGLAPAGVLWLRGGDGPAVLRYPPGALVAIAGVGGPALAARVVDRARVPVLDAPADRLAWLAGPLGAGGGAVAVLADPGDGHRLALAGAAAAAGVPAHLVLLEAVGSRAGLGDAHDPAPFGSVTVLDGAAAGRLRRIAISPSSRG